MLARSYTRNVVVLGQPVEVGVVLFDLLLVRFGCRLFHTFVLLHGQLANKQKHPKKRTRCFIRCSNAISAGVLALIGAGDDALPDETASCTLLALHYLPTGAQNQNECFRKTHESEDNDDDDDVLPPLFLAAGDGDAPFSLSPPLITVL